MYTLTFMRHTHNDIYVYTHIKHKYICVYGFVHVCVYTQDIEMYAHRHNILFYIHIYVI